MLSTLERIFEVVEANASCVVLAVTASFVMTGCLRLLCE